MFKYVCVFKRKSVCVRVCVLMRVSLNPPTRALYVCLDVCVCVLVCVCVCVCVCQSTHPPTHARACESLTWGPPKPRKAVCEAWCVRTMRPRARREGQR